MARRVHRRPDADACREHHAPLAARRHGARATLAHGRRARLVSGRARRRRRPGVRAGALALARRRPARATALGLRLRASLPLGDRATRSGLRPRGRGRRRGAVNPNAIRGTVPALAACLLLWLAPVARTHAQESEPEYVEPNP